MSSVLVDVADAIKTELNTAFAASTFGATYASVVAARSYADWDDDLITLDDAAAKVDVVPLSAKHSQMTRGLWRYLVLANVGVRYKFGDDKKTSGRIETAQIDAFTLLTQQIGEYFAPCGSTQTARRLSSLSSAVWAPTGDGGESGSNFRIWYLPEHLRFSQFTGLVQLGYWITRRAA